MHRVEVWSRPLSPLTLSLSKGERSHLDKLNVSALETSRG
jgi:hypothetical protein